MLWPCHTGAVALAVGFCVVLVAGCQEREPVRRSGNRIDSPPDTSSPTLITSTTSLKSTVVVPTLDTPVPDAKSAIWCLSFQLAWNAFERDLTHGPTLVHHAEDVSRRLNAARQSEADLEPADYFIATGPAKDVIDRIGRDLPRRFPGAEPPRLEIPPVESFVAFAFLKAGVRYTSEFSDNPHSFEFVDSAKNRTVVDSFGLLPDAIETGRDTPFARKQVALLWLSGEEFAVDLCRDSKPYQVVLAMLKRKGTLAEMLADEETQRRLHAIPESYRLYEDHLLVPNMSWRVDHHFQELEGADKTLLTGAAPGWFIVAAVQQIQFKLDRRGAEVASGAYVIAQDGGPKTLYFNRPFLIYLKKRDAAQPFFVMWVDNAELMQPRAANEPKAK